MKKFLIKAAPYVGVIIVFILTGEFLLYRLKENVPVSTIVEKQARATDEVYYNKTEFNNILTTYKFECLQAKKPSIAVIGQSIVLNFRDFFFHPMEADFYNTGLMIRNVSDFEYLAELLKNNQVKKPEFMVVGIDFGMVLQKNPLDHDNLLENLKKDPVYDYKQHLIAIQNMYLEPAKREAAANNLGYGKRGLEGNGYRKDGSFSFKWEMDLFLTDCTHFEGPFREDLIHKRAAFDQPIAFDQVKWERVQAALKAYKDLGIEMVLYYPPLSDEFYTFAMKDPAFNAFWTQYLNTQEVFKKQGYDVIPFSTPAMLSLNDYYMNNANHPGDIYVAKQFYTYCTSPERKSTFVNKIDTAYLNTVIHEPGNNPLSFIRDNRVIYAKRSK